MKVILYNAISVDGFIAGERDETPWSDEEWDAFQGFVKTCDVCLLGRRTYGIMRDGGEFVDGPKYIVITNDVNADTGDFEKLSIKSVNDLPKVDRIGLIGGGELNGSLAEMGIIDEIILDVEAVTLGGGKLLFGSKKIQLDLELLSSKRIGPKTVQNHYAVVK
jgi:dihydrofolate reductase